MLATSSSEDSFGWSRSLRKTGAHFSCERSRIPLLLLAEISLPHLVVRADRLRRAGRDDTAIDQDGVPVGEGEHRLHVVLDQQYGQLALELAQDLDHACALVRPHPGHRLVEQE